MSKYLKGFFNKPGQGQTPKNEETPTSGQTPQDKKASRDPLDKVDDKSHSLFFISAKFACFYQQLPMNH